MHNRIQFLQADRMQRRWVRIPRGPATVMRVCLRDKPGRCVCLKYRFTIDGFVHGLPPRRVLRRRVCPRPKATLS